VVAPPRRVLKDSPANRPVVLGGGKRPFAEGSARLGLELGSVVPLRSRRA
jgi:hypothetical protein